MTALAQIVFAVFACLVMLAVVTAFATAVHFNVGEAAGLLSGSLTQSAAIGTASDAIARLKLRSGDHEDAPGPNRHRLRRRLRPRHHHRRAGLLAARAGSLPL